MFNSPKSFQLFLDAHGFEANLDGINNEEYIEAIQYLMRRYLPNDAPEIIFGLYNKAYSGDPQLTEKKLQISSLGNAAFKSGNYEVALPIFLKELEKEIDLIKERNREVLGRALDYLEAAIIINSEEHIDDALLLSEDWMVADENRQATLNLLSGIIAINKGDAYSSPKPQSVKNWNFDMLLDWIELNSKPELKEKLKQWVYLFQQSP